MRRKSPERPDVGRGEVGAFQALEPGPGSRSDVREAGEDTEGARREAQDLEEAQQASRIRETTDEERDNPMQTSGRRVCGERLELGQGDGENPGWDSTAVYSQERERWGPWLWRHQEGKGVNALQRRSQQDLLMDRKRGQGREGSRTTPRSQPEQREGQRCCWRGRRRPREMGRQWGVTPSVGHGDTHALSRRPGGNATWVPGAHGQVPGAGRKGAWSARDCPS